MSLGASQSLRMLGNNSKQSENVRFLSWRQLWQWQRSSSLLSVMMLVEVKFLLATFQSLFFLLSVTACQAFDVSLRTRDALLLPYMYLVGRSICTFLKYKPYFAKLISELFCGKSWNDVGIWCHPCDLWHRGSALIPCSHGQLPA